MYIAVQLVILWDDTIYHLFLSLASYKSTGETKLTEESKIISAQMTALKHKYSNILRKLS